MPPKVKLSHKGRKKIHKTPEQSHTGKMNQQYNPKKWEKAFELKKKNETLAPGEPKWTSDKIAEETGIPKLTLGHRFNTQKTGTWKGMGHIARGSRKGRILGKVSKQDNCTSSKTFFQTFRWFSHLIILTPNSLLIDYRA